MLYDTYRLSPYKHALRCDKFRLQGLTPAVSTSTGATASSCNGSSSPPYEVDAMMVDPHRRGNGDGSRGMDASSVSAAVAAVVSSAPAHASGHEMHRVLSASILSPPGNSGRGGSGMNQNRPPLRQVCLTQRWFYPSQESNNACL